jgi:hypothetical protein
MPYYRAVGVLTPWSSIGATMDDTTMRIDQSWFRPDLNGMLGPIQEMDYLTEQNAELEFTMVEVAGDKMALAVPGATSTTTSNVVDGAGLSTTTTAAVAIGATTIPLTATTNLAVGDWIKIGASNYEYRQVTAISSLNVSFRDPIQTARASGVAVVETAGDGKVDITGASVRRQPATAYHAWALVAEAPVGYFELLLDSGISATDSAELNFGDETVGGIRTTIASRYNGSTPNTSPWHLRVPA